MVTNGDIVRNMDNQNLAEIFCAIISKTIHKDYLKRKILFKNLTMLIQCGIMKM